MNVKMVLLSVQKLMHAKIWKSARQTHTSAHLHKNALIQLVHMCVTVNLVTILMDWETVLISMSVSWGHIR